MAASLIILHGILNTFSPRKNKIGLVPIFKLFVFLLSGYAAFGLMVTIVTGAIALSVFLFCLSRKGRRRKGAPRVLGAKKKRARRGKSDCDAMFELMPDLSKAGKTGIAVLLLISFSVLAAEVYLCPTLLKISPAVSWHAPFDFLFWQVFWVFIQVVVLSKPGSLWRNGAKAHILKSELGR